MINYDNFDLFDHNDFMDLLQRTTATAAQTPPPCTEILPEEALRYIDAIRKAAYEQGYNEGRIRGIEDVKNRIKSSLDL
jgi:hypothetical protein